MAADARCYFVLDSSRHFTSVIACGPVRRSDSADRHVWDLYSSQVQDSPTSDAFSSTNTATVSGATLSTASPGATGSERPSGDLFRPDGRLPASDADVLKAPARPLVDPALLATTDLAGVQTTDAVSVDPSKNAVISPAATVVLTQVAQVPLIAGRNATVITGNSLDDAKNYVAAPGFHLQVFTVTTTKGWPKSDTAVLDSGATPPNGTVTFVNGPSKIDISGKVGLTGYSPTTTVSFVASVANGSTPTLSIGVAGHAQDIAIPTASRIADLVSAAYYRSNRQIAVNASSPT